MNVSGLLGSIQKLAVRKSPEILIGFGVASLVTCVVLAVKASPKSKEVWTEKEHTVSPGVDTEYQLKHVDESGNHSLSNYLGSDIRGRAEYVGYLVRDFAPIWGPTVVAGLASVGFFIAANHIHVKRQAMLAVAYSLSEKALTTYQKKVVENLGEKKHLEVMDSIAEDEMRKNPYRPETAIITAYGDTRFYDEWSGRYFLSDINEVRKAENTIIKRLSTELCLTVNDYYYELGLPSIPGGSIVGWDVNDILLDVNYSPIFDSEGHPCTAISYLVGVLESRYRVL